MNRKEYSKMSHSLESFYRRMKKDRSFRYTILAAWKSGELAEVLQGEGYSFTVEELECELPRVSTGLRAGSCRSCHCHTPCELGTGINKKKPE